MLARWTAGLLVAFALATPAAKADPVADFYKGRQLNVVVGYGPGGGYDVYARLLARHIGKYIPGNPTVIVQNMPGAGSLRAVNYLYTTAPKDGTTIAIFGRDMPLIGLLGGNPNFRFDPRKLTWLDSTSSFANDAYILMVRKDAPVRTIEEARKPGGTALVLGGTAEGATGNDVPVILHDTIGINVKVVAGYPDSNGIFLAMERGEIMGRTVDLSSVRSLKPEWLKSDSSMRVLVQYARATRNPELPDVPTARELASDEKARRLIEVAEIPYTFSRPFAAPPDIPADRARALETAFLAVHKDADFLKDAAILKLDVSPVGSAEAQQAIERIATSPPEVLDYLRNLFSHSKKSH